MYVPNNRIQNAAQTYLQRSGQSSRQQLRVPITEWQRRVVHLDVQFRRHIVFRKNDAFRTVVPIDGLEKSFSFVLRQATEAENNNALLDATRAKCSNSTPSCSTQYTRQTLKRLTCNKKDGISFSRYYHTQLFGNSRQQQLIAFMETVTPKTTNSTKR